VFLLDEPFSNLDAQLRFSARKFLREVQRKFGITTIYVTHDQSEALSISDRVAIMGDGKIHQVGTPREIYSSPADEFTATFIGSPPLNVLSVNIFRGMSSPVFLPLEGVADGDCKVGIRPEGITLGTGSNEAEITAIEFAGRETIVYLRIAGIEIRAVVLDNRGLNVGEKVRFRVQRSALHILGKEAG
jgi:ABC-type sugar transport system ATPase subunit